MTPRPSWTATCPLSYRRAGRRGRAGRPGASSPRGSSPATGSPSGPRTASSGPSPQLGLHTAGAVLVPLNTRFKGNEAAYVLGKARARLLFTVTDFLDTDYVALLDGRRRPRHPSRRSSSSGARPPTAPRPGPTSWPGPTRSTPEAAAERAAGVDGDDTSDILFTSGTTGPAQGGDAAPRRRHPGLRRLVDGGRPAGGRPLPHHQPVLPRLRPQGGDPGQPDQGGHDPAPAGLRRARP